MRTVARAPVVRLARETGRREGTPLGSDAGVRLLVEEELQGLRQRTPRMSFSTGFANASSTIPTTTAAPPMTRKYGTSTFGA